MSRHPKSSSREASKAAKVLRSTSASEREKMLTASALSQARPNADTSPEMAERAARALESRHASATARSLAGSVLSQARTRG